VVGVESDRATDAVGDEGVVAEGRKKCEEINMSIG
jgi:hypothetical protein